jgi:hypothetical protein
MKRGFQKVPYAASEGFCHLLGGLPINYMAKNIPAKDETE